MLNTRAAAFNRALIYNSCIPMRRIKLHEYQAGALLHSHKIPIPIGHVAFTAAEAQSKADTFKTSGYVVKAQVLTGGRGLGHFKENGFQGGVHIVDTPDKVGKIAKEMIGKSLVTKQSGDKGFPCGSVYIVEKLGIEKEMYLSLTLDRKAGCPTFIYSPAGGMSIEDVAHTNPEKIFKLQVNVQEGPKRELLVQAAKDLGLEN